MAGLTRRGNLNADMYARREKGHWGHREKTAVAKPRREASEGTSPCGLLALRLAASGTVREQISIVEAPQASGLCYGSPSKQRHPVLQCGCVCFKIDIHHFRHRLNLFLFFSFSAISKNFFFLLIIFSTGVVYLEIFSCCKIYLI